MLGFFQKYQRFFFIFVTVIIVASFTFFGVFDTFVNTGKTIVDRQIGETFDGSPMMLLEVQRLSRFIATDAEDMMSHLHSSPNLCNDGVIRNDLLRTGVSDLLVDSYFDVLQGDFTQRLERAKRYRGYENAEAPFLNAKFVWDRFMPSISKELEALKAEEEASILTFSHLSNLYLQQASCPPEFLKRVLMYYASQTPSAKPDPYLPYADLSLFGFHSLADWFGANFVDLSAQFILNVARFAEQKGHRVSLEEAKGDLLRNFQAAVKKQPAHQVTFSSHLRSLGFDERGASEVWRSVLLFRRYFQGVAQATFVDQMPYRDFAAFARDISVVQKYEWPPHLHLKTGQDLIEFQIYLHAIGGRLNDLSLPSQCLALETIARQTPELVQTTYRMKVAQVSLEEVGLRASLKQILDWQMEDQNWSSLALVPDHKNFQRNLRPDFSTQQSAESDGNLHQVVELERKAGEEKTGQILENFCGRVLEKAETREERFRCLEALPADKRKKIDLHARLEWAKKNTEAIDEQLLSTASVEKTVSVSQNWISLPGIGKSHELGALIELAANGDPEMKRLLERYSEKDKTFYRFEAIETVAPMHVLTFEEARDLGVATLVADRFLEAEYKKIRSQFPTQFQVKEGEWKLFSSVKEEVARHVFGDLIRKMGGEKEPLAYYASHRLEVPAKEVLMALQKNPEGLASCENSIVNQFKCLKNECLVQRTTKDEWMREQVFIMMPNEWSPVYVPADGNVTFFYFERRQENQEPILEQISFGKEVIAADTQRYVTTTLLAKAKQKRSIVIPMHNKEIE